MKIMSLNMAGRNNFGGDFDGRMEDIVAFLDRERADVVCLQEVTFTKGQSLADKVNDMMGDSYPSVLAQMSENCTFEKFGERFRKKWDAGLIEHDGDYVTDGMAILSKESTDFEDYISFPSGNATFDHMLLSKDWEFEKIERVDGVSDHFAMIFTINRAD